MYYLHLMRLHPFKRKRQNKEGVSFVKVIEEIQLMHFKELQ